MKETDIKNIDLTELYMQYRETKESLQSFTEAYQTIEAEYDAKLKAARERVAAEWCEANAELIVNYEEASAQAWKAEAQLRQAVVDRYNAASDKGKQISPELGLSVRVDRKVGYDAKKARAWASARPDFLILDTKAFEKVAKDEQLRGQFGIDFVSVEEIPVAVIKEKK